jgi:hypothetical protein
MPVMYKPISPKKLKLNGLRAKLEKHARPYADGIKRDFEKTYSTWSAESKPQQIVKVEIDDNGVRITNDLIGDIYQFVHDGTEGPYEIKPKRAKRLKFSSGYNAKTVIGQIRSQSGGPTGETIYSKGVTHPGIKARNFSKIIMPKWRKPFFDAMKRALDEWASQSGHKL